MTNQEAQEPAGTEGGLEHRVLVLAPTGVDGEITAQIFAEAGIACEVYDDVDTLVEEISRGAGAVLITSEALTAESIPRLRKVIDGQPAWSDIPLLVFTPGSRTALAGVLGPRANVTLVDRPIHVDTLLSVTWSALRARHRQYHIRTLLEAERLHAERLASLADASMAIASTLSLGTVIQMLTDRARELLGASIAVTSIEASEEAYPPIFAASTDDDAWRQFLTEHHQELRETFTETLRLSSGDCADSALAHTFSAAGSPGSPHNAICASLTDDQGVSFGFIALLNKPDGDFTAEDEAVLVQLATMTSASVQKARLFQEAQEANRAKDDFLATLAHELRTPMTAIIGWLQMLKEDPHSEDAKTAIAMIEGSTQVQARLVEDLMDVSRIIAGKLRVQRGPVELGPLVQRIASTYSATAEEQGVKIESDITPDPVSVWGDPTRLQQVVWNLLSNAIKFTPSGGTVAVKLAKEGSSAVLRVRDSGAGIAPDFLPHVFERFRQAEKGTTTTRSHSGLGLGLAIVRHLVELHGGTVEARSEGLGNGAEFVVTLPIRAVHPADAEEIQTMQQQLTGYRILVVDDDEEARHMLEKVLEQFGAGVRVSASVGEAIETLRSYDADLVISDIAMPGEDGYALIRRLKDLTHKMGRDVPALALSAYGREENQMRVLSAGFREYVQKPVNPAQLARIIAELVAE